jgi:hypothetical protein
MMGERRVMQEALGLPDFSRQRCCASNRSGAGNHSRLPNAYFPTEQLRNCRGVVGLKGAHNDGRNN